ncbi:GNAT family N-acetyltransferase [Candidatus Dojkabacteria bacterium]|uniref:GNAT family N-acetyltransferase n=1 Tax=Candidatus Dojkabacteria bacterium TaxID=2099670 RepID=A0A955L8T5_9BACT|nr:GNAT family N-acetyltransferase [Candidatus Dojkabacteria bacterium]
MNVDLQKITDNPIDYTVTIPLKGEYKLIWRPLEHNDIKKLTKFLSRLSDETRNMYILDSYDEQMAKELCDAIAKYDKLRFVVEESENRDIIGLFDFSFDIPSSDRARFSKYKFSIDLEKDCRVGFCVSDEFQGMGIGQASFSCITSIAEKLGKQRLILLGGVFKENTKSTGFYTKLGFKKIGTFLSPDERMSYDMIYTIG